MTAEKKVIRRLGQRSGSRTTKIEGQPQPNNIEEASFFDVYELEIEDDDGTLELTISGNEFAIALQASLLDAVDRLIQYRLSKLRVGSGANSDKIKRSGHPEVRLFFFQRRTETELDYQPLKGEISFDLMYLTDTITAVRPGVEVIKESDIKRLSRSIKAVFSDSYKWSRGDKMVTYHDWGRGYQLQVQCSTYIEGERIVADVLRVQGHEVIREFLKHNKVPYPAAKKQPETVLGKVQKHRRAWAKGDVYFSHATLKLPSFNVTRTIA